MNNAFPSRSITNRLRRSKSPGEAELNALFQLLPGPALMVDQSGVVLQANGAFLKLTTFSQVEVGGRET